MQAVSSRDTAAEDYELHRRSVLGMLAKRFPRFDESERLEIYPFLGSYLLGEAIDRAGADLVLHGHAHAGTEKGVTPGGIHVRNVAQPVIGHAYKIYCVHPARSELACA